jgi:hypothetical protein
MPVATLWSPEAAHHTARDALGGLCVQVTMIATTIIVDTIMFGTGRIEGEAKCAIPLISQANYIARCFYYLDPL